MARLPASESAFLEQKEGSLGRLANALVLLELVDLRIALAAQREPEVLSPAVDDVQRIRGLIVGAQRGLSGLTLPPGCSRVSED